MTTAALVLTGLTACATEPPPGQLAAQLQTSVGSNTAKAGSSSTQYSLTQVVKNNSTVPLTLQGAPVVDNNGAVQPGYSTVVAAQTSETYKATNTGNGVQMWLHFNTPDGATIIVDSDVPKVNGNRYDHNITGSNIGFDDNNTFINSGDNPQAQVTVETCTSGCTTEASNGGIIS